MNIWCKPAQTHLRQRCAHLVAHRSANGSAKPETVDTLTSTVTGSALGMDAPCVTSQPISLVLCPKFSTASTPAFVPGPLLPDNRVIQRQAKAKE